jgi:N-acetyltransferase B complex (NatB) non catalytic subunit
MAPPPKLISRPVSAAESERRLRPAIEALYGSNNPKQALKICAQAEGKRPGWPAARALRAIAFHRLGRRKEADAAAASIIDDIVDGRVPADEDAAIKLHLFYREVPNREHLSARAYEAVACTNLTDLYLSEASFMFHIRAREFAAAQKIAFRLQRAASEFELQQVEQYSRPQEEYGWWNVAALWLANRKNPTSPATQNPKLIKLAAAMLKKALAVAAARPSARPPTPEFARFTARVMCEAGDFSAASAVLSSAKSVMDSSEASNLIADFAFLTGDRPIAAKLYRTLLSDSDADDWGHWLRFIDVSPPEDALAFAESLCTREMNTERPNSRGQFIAEMELRARCSDISALRKSVVRYFCLFGTKPVCAHDLRPYIHVIQEHVVNGAASICEELDRICDALQPSQHLNVSWIRLWFGCLKETPSQLCARYEDLLDDSVIMEATERQVGDDYLLLAAHQLLPLNLNESRYLNVSAIFQTIVLIEAGLTRSPFNFHFKLLLTCLYIEIGAVERAYDVWSTLDIKHVQVSTLGHLVIRPMLNHGVNGEFKDVVALVDKLWLECEREIPESIWRAFADGAINAAVEFVEFRDRIERSATLVDALLCEALTHLCFEQGETLGLERAWRVLGDDARILPTYLDYEQHPLIANQDLRCMEFWNVDTYSPDCCRVDTDAPGSHEGPAMPVIQQKELLIEMLVTRCVIRLGRGEDLRESQDLVLLQRVSIEDELSAGHAVFLRSMILTVAQAYDALSGNSAAQETVSASKTLHPTSVQYLVDMQAYVVNLSNNGVNVPRSLGMVGRFVFETFTLTCIALSSLSKASLRKSQRPVSSSASPSPPLSPAAHARESVSNFVEALSDAAKAILDFVSIVAGDKFDDSVLIAKCTSDVVPFIPDVLPAFDEERGTVDFKLVRNRESFSTDVYESIALCHKVACTRIASTIQSAMQRLKMVVI